MVTFVERRACPSCAGTDFRLLKALPFDDPGLRAYLERCYGGRVPPLDGTYTLCRCQDCGFIFQQAILDDAGMQALYNQWISAEDSLSKREFAPLRQRIGYLRQGFCRSSTR